MDRSGVCWPRMVGLHLKVSYMASGDLNWKRRFVVIAQGFPDVLLNSQASRCLVPRVVLGVVVTSPDVTWPLSLPMRGMMWMSQPTTYTILLPTGDRLGHRAR
jgi:hypothetical protein